MVGPVRFFIWLGQFFLRWFQQRSIWWVPATFVFPRTRTFRVHSLRPSPVTTHVDHRLHNQLLLAVFSGDRFPTLTSICVNNSSMFQLFQEATFTNFVNGFCWWFSFRSCQSQGGRCDYHFAGTPLGHSQDSEKQQKFGETAFHNDKYSPATIPAFVLVAAVVTQANAPCLLHQRSTA